MHICTEDEVFFKQLLKAKGEFKKEKKPVTVPALAEKVGRVHATIYNFLGKYPGRKHTLKPVSEKRGPKDKKKPDM